MNKIFTFITLFLLTSWTASAQVFRKAEPVICPADPKTYDTFVSPRKAISNAQARGLSKSKTADIVVDYNGFTPEAQTAFQYAVDIWASLLKSPVTIYVNANFTDLGEGVLGSAGPTSFVTNFHGAPSDTSFYPIPLAEKLAGYSLNAPGDPDITSNFSSSFNFYFGLDGNPPAGQYDFVSIVLHELGHGLGFTGAVSFNTQNNIGSWDLGTTEKPSIYTSYVEAGNGDLITDLPFESLETGEAFISNNLFFNGLLSASKLGSRPKLFAPTTWNGGSSYSHLDENTYPAGNPNSLMSPQFGAGEAIHDPGVSLDIFADMGWVHTYLIHENENQLTNNISEPFLINLSVTSDITYKLLEPVVVYTTSTFESADTILMADTGDGVNFEASIPNPGNSAVIKYYFSGITDGTSRNYTSPFIAPRDYFAINILNLPSKNLPYTLTDGGNFESNANDFNALALNGGMNLWEYGVPGNRLNEAASGTNAWKTLLQEDIERAKTRYSSALVSPIFDFSDDSKNHQLKFKFSMENAYTEAIGLFESGPLGLNVEYSLDNGQSWMILGDKDDEAGSNWYNVEENSPNVFPIQSNIGWIKQTIEVIEGDTVFIPQEVSYNVSKLSGNNRVIFRIVFYVAQDFIAQGYNVDGVLIDDFEIITGSPTAEFKTNSPSLLFPGDAIQFEYVSTGASSYLWDFGDGNTSTEENPTYSYSEGGSYNVSLTITSADGEATLTKENYITVINTRQIPYSLADGGNLEGDAVDFTILNIAGTGFEVGNSTISGKEGTASGNSAFVTGVDDATYSNDSEAYIYTPEFDFKGLGNYAFSFKTKYSFEENWDGFIVEYSTDRGQTWLKLRDERDAETWYNSISDPQSIFGNNVPIFSGNTGGEFQTKSADVSFLGGQGKASFRIKFLTDAAEVDAGMAIDDFELSGPTLGPALPSFGADMVNACVGSIVTFSNASDGTIKGLEWNFGENATPQTASGNGPHEVVYNQPGIYTVSLIAEDFVGAFVTKEVTEYIQIGATHLPTIEAGELNNEFERVLTASEGDVYQWFQGADSIPGATERTFISSETAVYSVAVMIDGCTAFSNPGIITSSKSAFNQSLRIYPNPINGNSNLNISFENDYVGQYEVRIQNLTGATVKTYSFDKNQTKENKEISVENLDKGLYIINVHIGGNSSQRKIIIE